MYVLGSCQPWQVLRKASPIRAGTVSCPGRPFGTETVSPCATVYSSFLCRLSHCHLSETRCKALRTYIKATYNAERFKCASGLPGQDERPFDRLRVLSPEQSRGTRIGAERSPPRWGGRASFRKPARAGYCVMCYLTQIVYLKY